MVGSLVDWTRGSINCTIIDDTIASCPYTAKVPTSFDIHNYGPEIRETTTLFYRFSCGTSSAWPTHDPCGNNQYQYTKTSVTNPFGSIYVR